MSQTMLPVGTPSLSSRPGSTVPKPIVTGATPSLGWDAFLQRARSLDKTDLVPSPSTLTRSENLPAGQSAPIKRAVVLVPDNPSPGLQIALDDLVGYLKTVTRQPVTQLPLSSQEVGLAAAPDATVIAIGQGTAVPGLVPPASGHSEGYRIQTGTMTSQGATIPVIGVNGDDLNGQQYGIYRLMELSGKRYFSYMDDYTPPAADARFPADGFSEVHAPSDQMQVRGFAPHTYHPIPLSIALHDPSPEHLEMVKKYIDWLVQNGQNYVQFPLLDLDAKNPYLDLPHGDKNYQAWLPYAKEIVDYAHQRGVQVSANIAFAEYVSSNIVAVNPIKALAQTFQLDLDKNDPASYEKHLDKATASDAKDIQKLMDKMMEVPWDEVCWNMGTSEFTSTNDDLSINWMNSAADYLKAHYPNTRTSVNSHVPSQPYSKKYDEPYFNLVDKAEPDVGLLVHTSHEYGLTGPAPVYGNDNNEHKLKLLYDQSGKRLDIYYPETSYWVQHDASVPLFLPVYMLNRAADIETIKPITGLNGEVDFTTAWEWGYWLNDYAVARMQSHPDENLTQIMDGAFEPFGSAREPMVQLMNDTMLEQQKYLIDKGLLRHLQGFDSLSDFGMMARHAPVLDQIFKTSNNIPERLKPSTIMGWSAKQIASFEQGELADVDAMVTSFDSVRQRMDSLKDQVPESAQSYYQELEDGFTITYLRAREAKDVLHATVDARKAQLQRNDQLKAEGRTYVDDAKSVVDQAMQVIHEREKHYRDAPEYTYQQGHSHTMWNNRYLTPVDTGEYWTNSLAEAEKLYRPDPQE